VLHGGPGGTEVDHNEASLGGGIYVGERATLRIENDNVKVVHNAANANANAWENSGGGIFAIGGATSASSIEVTWLTGEPDAPTATPRGFLLANNRSTGNGGGLALHGTASFSAMEATIQDNTAGGTGGGIHLYGNQLGTGASAFLSRRSDVLPAWIRP